MVSAVFLLAMQFLPQMCPFHSAQAKRYGTFLIYQGRIMTGLNLHSTTGVKLLVIFGLPSNVAT